MDKKFDQVFFDFDSTLVTVEGVDYLGRLAGVEREVSTLTEMAMNGDIAFEDVFDERLKLIKPNEDMLNRLTKYYSENITSGAMELIRKLRSVGTDVYVVSGGYTNSIVPVVDEFELSIENVFAVEIKLNANGEYDGYDDPYELHKSGGKKRVFESVSSGKTAFVGDAATDLECLNSADLFVGFGGVVYREQIEESCDIYIRESNLLAAQEYLFIN